jgi:hypothetical protein
MTAELRAARAWAGKAACASGTPQSMRLQAKGIDFGTIMARPSKAQPCTPNFDESGIEGVDADLVIRPFRWKGADVMCVPSSAKPPTTSSACRRSSWSVAG